MLICCDIPFSQKHFFPRFLFIHVSMAFLKETVILKSTNTEGQERRGGDKVWETLSLIFPSFAYTMLVLAGPSCLHVFIYSLSLSVQLDTTHVRVHRHTHTLRNTSSTLWQLQIWLPIQSIPDNSLYCHIRISSLDREIICMHPDTKYQAVSCSPQRPHHLSRDRETHKKAWKRGFKM